MTIDIAAAASFTAGHARLLDRRRLQLLLGNADPASVVTALDAYANPDGGYGWGLEPDLRAAESQPGGALHAFEVFEEIGPATVPQAARLCDWMASVSGADGGVPFALPVADPAACAPFWAEADTTTSSLHITAAVTGAAHRVAHHDPAVAAHPWLATATTYCLDAIAAHGDEWHALELLFSLQFLDAASDTNPAAAEQLERLGRLVPADGRLHVGGGRDDEFVRALDFAPFPDRPVRRLFSADVVEAELDRLADRQRDDGGWPEEFDSYSPMAALEWRGYLTVNAISILVRNDR